MIVEEGEDLHPDACAEPPVGEVGLPGLVGELGLEAQVGGTGTLPGLWGDQPVAFENFPDCGNRRATAVASIQVEGDGVGSGIVTLPGELPTQLHDLGLEFGTDLSRIRKWSFGSGFDRVPPARQVALDQGINPGAGDTIVTGDFRFGPALQNDGSDNDTGLGHGASRRQRECPLCLETPVLNVKKPDTATPTMRIRREFTLA